MKVDGNNCKKESVIRSSSNRIQDQYRFISERNYREINTYKNTEINKEF